MFFHAIITVQREKCGDKRMNYGNYRTIQVVKQSERAEVLFAAVDELEQPIVVKRLKEANPEIYREVAKLQNEHIPQIYQVQEQEDVLCVVEEYIDGRTLEDYLKEETLSDIDRLELMVQLCDALEVLHRCVPPVIHRDIKPSNILVTTDGILKIIDFDAARQYKTEKNTGDTRLLGTIEYAAPEQFGYAQTDLRSDIYSAGVVFSEITINKTASYAKEWKRLVDKCTSFDPENRYKNVPELKRDLLKCIIKAKKKRNKWFSVSVAVLLSVLLIGISVVAIGNKADKESQGNADSIEEAETGEPTQKRIVGERTETVGYLISAMDYVESNNLSYHINDSGSLSLNFDKIYGSITYELPDIIDMNYCVDAMARIKSEVGDIAVILYDENRTAVETFYVERLDETKEVFFSPKYKGKVAYVGFMANDGDLEDYSEFAATIYYVDFMVINPGTPKISYTMAELAEENYYFMERTYNEDGSVTLDFERLYGELMLRFPKEIDLRYCTGIGVVMESEVGDLSVNFYDDEFEHVESFYDYTTDGIKEKLLNPLSGALISGIGLMIDDQELEDFTDCNATIYAVNFYMQDGYVVE